MERKLRIVVADDIEQFAQNIVSIVEKNQKVEKVITASNGKEAIDKILENDADIVFTDMQMPVMTGIEVIEETQKLDFKKQIQFILVTSDRSPDLVIKSRSMNFNIEYKPINAERINSYINEFEQIDEKEKNNQKQDAKKKEGFFKSFIKKLK